MQHLMRDIKTGLRTIEKTLAHWFPPLLKPVSKLHVVGGAVRDLLRGLPAGDLDLVCDGAREVAETLAAKRRASLVTLSKSDFRPCFRLVERGARASSIDISPIEGGDISLDLAARDFTVNSMAIQVLDGPRLGALLDPFGGAGDINLRRLRMTAPDVFRSDPLRVFRAFRLAAETGFTIEPATLSEAAAGARLLPATAGERIRTELELFLDRPGTAGLAADMLSAGVVHSLLPERAPKAPGLEARVLERVERVLEDPGCFFKPLTPALKSILGREERRFSLKIAALFLDATGHLSVDLAEAISRRLRASRKQRDRLRVISAGYGYLFGLREREPDKLEGLEWFRFLGDELPGAFVLASAVVDATGLQAFCRDRAGKAVTWYMTHFREALSRPALVEGKDLAALGISPGPEMGKILKYIRNAQDLGEVADKMEAMRLAGEICRSAR